jgi:hypothetical protein
MSIVPPKLCAKPELSLNELLTPYLARLDAEPPDHVLTVERKQGLRKLLLKPIIRLPSRSNLKSGIVSPVHQAIKLRAAIQTFENTRQTERWACTTSSDNSAIVPAATWRPLAKMQKSLATRRANGNFCSTNRTVNPVAWFSLRMMSPIS